MAEYIEREAVNKLLHKEIERTWHRVWGSVIWNLSYKISQIPAADVVEVVRCKDCKYFDQYSYLYSDEPSGFGKCEKICMDIDLTIDDFCSYGEKKCE